MNRAALRETDPDTTDHTNCAQGNTPDVLPRIYEDEINIVVLRRTLSEQITGFCQQLIVQKPNFQLLSVLNNERSSETLNSMLPELEGKPQFVQDLALLVDMYSCLFELEEVGLRIQVLHRAMCPRFHTDKLGCRLVTTYQGVGSEWLPDAVLDRSKLGSGNMGLSDDASGLYDRETSIQQVSAGDVVLLKGDGWYGNDGAGIVHRSPAVAQTETRIVVTMDFA